VDAGIADTLNRQIATHTAQKLDRIDRVLGYEIHAPWYLAPIAATFMGENDTDNADRAWLVGSLVASQDQIAFDSYPADGDWELLFAAIRAEITGRRLLHARRAESGTVATVANH